MTITDNMQGYAYDIYRLQTNICSTKEMYLNLRKTLKYQNTEVKDVFSEYGYALSIYG